MVPTTVVDSYPVPAWLRAYNTREGLRDAVAVVLKTQELAGIDVVADGELDRWDVNHPESNGMTYLIGGPVCQAALMPPPPRRLISGRHRPESIIAGGTALSASRSACWRPAGLSREPLKRVELLTPALRKRCSAD